MGRCDYYSLPVATKLAMLSCLCSDVLDTGSIRAEMTRRTLWLELENQDPGARGLGGGSIAAIEVVATPEGGGVRKRGRPRKQVAVPSIRVETHLPPFTPVSPLPVPSSCDVNEDECFLCGMEGVLICCDGCPAAFHSRCVGVEKKGLPEGKWFCPECTAVAGAGGGGRAGVEGGARKGSADLREATLGVDSEGRSYLMVGSYICV